jgi:hypothetical protein
MSLTLAIMPTCYAQSSHTTNDGDTISERVIEGWVDDLGHDEHRRRRAAQRNLERLAPAYHSIARRLLVEKPDLEYGVRRHSILARYSGLAAEYQILDELRRYQQTGVCRRPELAAYIRLVGRSPHALDQYLAVRNHLQSFLVTAYAAPHYAEQTVVEQMNRAFDADRRVAPTDMPAVDALAVDFIGVFLVLCDRDIAIREHSVDVQFSRCERYGYPLIQYSMGHPRYGETLSCLVEMFIRTAGERGERFSVDARRKLGAAMGI